MVIEGGFQSLAIGNNSSIKSLCTFVFLIYFLTHCQVRFLEEELLGQMRNVCMILLNIVKFLSWGQYHFTFFPAVCEHVYIPIATNKTGCQTFTTNIIDEKGYLSEILFITSELSIYSKVMDYFHFFFCELPFISLDHFSLSFLDAFSCFLETLTYQGYEFCVANAFSTFVFFVISFLAIKRQIINIMQI